METLVQAAQLLLSLSILVILHEFGHYIPAKIFKTRVEKFYLFFNPWFSLFKKKIGDTEWGIGWLPLGGFVKISGMIDESMDKEQMALPPQPWEFRAKPAWQRLIIMLGGVTVNLILGMFIYAMVVFAYGEQHLKNEDVKYGLTFQEMFTKYGLKNGDKILKVEGKPVDNVMEINKAVFLRDARDLTVQHIDGSIVEVKLPADVHKEMFQKDGFGSFMPRLPIIIDSVVPNLPAAKAGLTTADKIISINGETVQFFDQLTSVLSENKNQTIDMVVQNGDSTRNLNVAVDSLGRIGFAPRHFTKVFKITDVKYGFGASFSHGISKGWWTVKDYVSQFQFVFTKKGASSIGGFGTIGKLFPTVWDWQVFWLNTAFISIVLAFMNILPIPALDGGHVVFLLYEMITGKEAPQKVLEVAQYIGFIILVSLLLYANGSDLFRWITG
ncbi:MAG: RIP metalloprotease RseP [Crocinitomicaceae bacterium]|nr:RIP metalloprotease RseP [Crocinitomicaceae bacterium]